jgi:hypothetical protein
VIWQVLVAPPPPVQHAVPAQQLAPHALGVAPLQAQLPEEQAWPAEQACPQVPQLEVSVATALQVPAQHASPAPQAVSQVPQWAAFVCRSKQPGDPRAVQSVRPAELQAQLPAAQRVFPGSVQASPQVPQFWGSTARSLQVPWAAHVVGCAGSKQPQVLVLQVSCASWVHAVAQSPQWRASRVRSRHHGHGSAAQWSAGPFGQEQLPPVHVPVPQDWPHPPQLVALVCTSTQVPPQQLLPVAQAFPHAPQFDPSESWSTQRSPHLICDGGQEDFAGVQPARRARATRAAERVRFTAAMIPGGAAPVHLRRTGAGAPRRGDRVSTTERRC